MIMLNDLFYKNAIKPLIENKIKRSNYVLVTTDYLDMLDAVSAKVRLGEFSNMDDTKLETLMDPTRVDEIRVILQELSNEGITQTLDMDFMFDFVEMDPNALSFNYDDTTDVGTVKYNKPLKLKKKYTSDFGEIFIYINSGLGKFGDTSSSYNLPSYVAFKIGDGIDADIQFDHVDEIEYIDSLTFKLKINNEI